MAKQFTFGDVVRCPGADAKEAPRLGIIAELRKDDCRVVHLRTGRSAWMPLSDLGHVGAPRDDQTLEQVIASLLEILGAVEFEFTTLDSGCHRLIAGHGAVVAEIADRVREILATRLKRYVMRPQGMHKMQTILEFSDS